MVIGYHDCGTGDPHGSTRRLLVLKNAEFWAVFEQQGSDLPEGRRREPEEGGLQCIALSGEGMALIDLHDTDGGTPSPGDLLESAVFSMLLSASSVSSVPHILLTFCQSRSLQTCLIGVSCTGRDISSGNVLRCSEPIWCPQLEI